MDKNNFINKDSKTLKNELNRLHIPKSNKNKNTPFWMPNIKTFLIIILFIFLCFEISFINCDNIIDLSLSKLSNNQIQNLITIHSGIGATLIAFAFFVAQSLNNKDDLDKGRVLLYKSYFFPLLTANILIFLRFFMGYISEITVILVASLALFIITRLSITINILLNNYKMEQSRKNMFFQLLKQKFINNINYNIDRKFRQQTVNKLSNDINERTNGLVKISRYDPNKHKILRELEPGEVVDISYKYLNKSISMIMDSYEKNINDIVASKNDNITEYNKPKDKDAVLFFIINYETEKDVTQNKIKISNDLLYTLDKRKKTKIINTIDKIFTIRQFQDLNESAKIEISKIKKRSINAIIEDDYDSFEVEINLYIYLMNEFYKYIKKHKKIDFDCNFRILDLLLDEIKQIINKAIETKKNKIIKKISYIPVKFAYLAVKQKDYSTFQNFTKPLIYLNEFSYYNDIDKETASHLFNLSIRYLKDLSEYYLIWPFKYEFNKDLFIKSSIHILKLYQEIIKYSIDYKNKDRFEICIKEVKELFETKPHNKDILGKESVKNILKDKKKQMIYGLANWSLYRIQNIDKDDKIILEIFEKLFDRLPSDFVELTELYMMIYEKDLDSYWGWSNWILFSKEKKKFHSINIYDNLENLYLLKSLSILKKEMKIERIKDEFPSSKHRFFYNTDNLIKKLEDLKTNNKDFKKIVNKDVFKKVDDLIAILNDVKFKQTELELEKLRKYNISQNKVRNFKEIFLKEFKKSMGIRNIFINFKLFVDDSVGINNEKARKLGINTVFGKEFFVEEETIYSSIVVPYDDYGFSKSIKNGENKIIFKKMKRDIRKEIRINEIKATIEEGQSNLFIISYNGISRSLFSNFDGNYKSKYQLKTSREKLDEFAGIYQMNKIKIPIYEIYTKSNEQVTFLLRKDRFYKLKQLSPLDNDNQEKYRNDFFFINVKEFKDDSIVNSLLNDSPEWLKEKGDIDKQKKYLKEKVLIHIFERFEITGENIWGYKLIP